MDRAGQTWSNIQKISNSISLSASVSWVLLVSCSHDYISCSIFLRWYIYYAGGMVMMIKGVCETLLILLPFQNIKKLCLLFVLLLPLSLCLLLPTSPSFRPAPPTAPQQQQQQSLFLFRFLCEMELLWKKEKNKMLAALSSEKDSQRSRSKSSKILLVQKSKKHCLPFFLAPLIPLFQKMSTMTTTMSSVAVAFSILCLQQRSRSSTKKRRIEWRSAL